MLLGGRKTRRVHGRLLTFDGIIQNSRCPEVQDQSLVIRAKPDIARLQIEVDDVVVVENLNGRADPRHDPNDFLLHVLVVQPPHRRVSAERHAILIRHDEVCGLVGAEEVDDFNDVAVSQFHHHSALIAESFETFGEAMLFAHIDEFHLEPLGPLVKLVGEKLLDGDRITVLVVGQVDDAEASTRKLFGDGVFPQLIARWQRDIVGHGLLGSVA